MELYGHKSKSIPQKTIVILLEIMLLYCAYWILFQEGGTKVLNSVGIASSPGNYGRRAIIFTFSIIVFIRMSFMMLYLLKRKMPWEETLSVSFAFALYYLGFALLAYNQHLPTDWIDFVGIFLFVFGSFINTFSELQRHFWKKLLENKGRLYTRGLFKYAMHINYFGDLLWVSAFAILCRNYYAILIPSLLFCLFVFWNIPELDNYLAEKYKGQFEKYKQQTKKFIPFVY